MSRVTDVKEQSVGSEETEEEKRRGYIWWLVFLRNGRKTL